ncbi:MAG: dicarboxylate/amino acid:cation symporter [Oscillospiraceae bacterium]|nr:dicarboxylate/amino acid:cation symporter [Oscillospiraceae bacterium]
MKRPRSLPVQIFLALLAGVAVGLLCFFLPGGGDFAAGYLKPFGDIFVNLLKFIVVPVVLFSMIQGILSMEDMRKVGSVGLKTVLYFLCTTAIACTVGLAMGSIFDRAGLFPVLDAADTDYEIAAFGGFMTTLVGIFPSNMWQAFTNANMLQVIVIALFFGGAILTAGEKGRLCHEIVFSFYAVIEKLMTFIIRLSPIGVFAYMAWVVATQGAQVLGSLALVLLCAYIAYVVHAVLVYSSAARVFGKLRPFTFFRKAIPAMIFGFTSASSAATLPVSKECAEDMGADPDVSSFVLPLGATINMDGTAIYQCVATVFLASCAGIDLTLRQMVLVVITATLASVGTAGVSGAGMIMLAMVLEAIQIPVAYIGLIIAVDRLFDMGRTCLNVVGDISCAVCVSRWEGRKQP